MLLLLQIVWLVIITLSAIANLAYIVILCDAHVLGLLKVPISVVPNKIKFSFEKINTQIVSLAFIL